MAQADDKKEQARTRREKQFQVAFQQAVDNHVAHAAHDGDGRKFLWWLLQIGKVSQQPFTANALTTAFQCGELNVGQQILARIIEVDPAVYVQMQQENLNEYRERVADPTNPSVDPSERPGGWDHPDVN